MTKTDGVQMSLYAEFHGIHSSARHHYTGHRTNPVIRGQEPQ